MKPSPPAQSETHVLLVDESSALRETLERQLGSDGFVVRTAANRHQALEQVRSHAIDLVLMNMLMPCAEGIGTLIAIRSFGPSMKIIAMSGNTGDAAGHFLPLAKSLGASALLPDPLDHTKLIDTIRGVLGEEAA